jgi:hypothetical protein
MVDDFSGSAEKTSCQMIQGKRKESFMEKGKNSPQQRKLRSGDLVYVRYRDHVLYHRVHPENLEPQMRECVGWIIYDCVDYIVVAWDRDADAPTLKGGDPKASGLVLLRSDILELKEIV